MLNDLRLALLQTLSPSLRALLWRSLGLTLSVFVVLLGGVWLLLDRFTATGWVWLDWLLQLSGFTGAMVLAWFLFPLAVSALLAFFADEVCAAVEARHYPALPPAREVPLVEALGEAARFALLALGLNLLVLPLYLFLPGFNLLIFLTLNGFLLGREYFDVVALRRHGRLEARTLRRRLGGRTWQSGAVVALFLLVPVVNLLAPLIGTAFMTHRYHRWRARGLIETSSGLKRGGGVLTV